MIKIPFEDAESVSGFIERGPKFPRELGLFSDSAYEELDRLVKLLFLDILLRRGRSIALVCDDDTFMPLDKTNYDRIATRMFPKLCGTHFEAFMLLYWHKTYNMDDQHIKTPEPCRNLIKYLNTPSTHLEQSLNSAQSMQVNEEYTFPFNTEHVGAFLKKGPTFPRGGSDILSESDYKILDVEFKHFWLTLLAKHYVTNSKTKYVLDESFMPCSSNFNMELVGATSEAFLLTSIYHPIVQTIFNDMYEKQEARVVIQTAIDMSKTFRQLISQSSLNERVSLKGQQDREDRRLAVAMALHPRLGLGMHWPLGEDNTHMIARYV